MQVQSIADVVREQIAVGIFVTLLSLSLTTSCGYCIKKIDLKSTASTTVKILTGLCALTTSFSAVNLGKTIKYYRKERQ